VPAGIQEQIKQAAGGGGQGQGRQRKKKEYIKEIKNKGRKQGEKKGIYK
jgi:hypothetical protein